MVTGVMHTGKSFPTRTLCPERAWAGFTDWHLSCDRVFADTPIAPVDPIAILHAGQSRRLAALVQMTRRIGS